MKLPILIGSCLLFFLSGAAAQAQSTSGNTEISVTIFPTTGLCRYPLLVEEDYQTGADITNILKPVGVLKVCSNYLGGFNISVSSTNGGELRNTTDANYKLDYQINGSTAQVVGGGTGYDIARRGNFFGQRGTFTAPFKPSTTPQRMYTSPTIFCNGFGRDGCDVGVQWRVTSTNSVPEGVYTDTLVYTLAGN